MKKLLLLLAAVAMLGAAATGCKINNSEAKKDVETFYSRLASPAFREDALRKGFQDWKVEKTDSNIVTRISVQEDMHFSSQVASKAWVEAQRKLTLDNYRRMYETDSLVRKAFNGMHELGMKYETVFYDNAGDSVVFVILPGEVAGIYD